MWKALMLLWFEREAQRLRAQQEAFKSGLQPGHLKYLSTEDLIKLWAANKAREEG